MTTLAFTQEQRRRGLLAVIASVTLAGVSYGLAIPLIALVLERQGWSATIIGLNAGTGSLAMIVMAPLLPRLMRRLGVVSTLCVGLGFATGALALMPLLPFLAAWFILRFCLGLGVAAHWVTSETWINRAASDGARGRIVATYVALLGIGWTTGSLLVRFLGTEGFLPFGLGAAAMLLAMAPIVLGRASAPVPPAAAPPGLLHTALQAPAVMATGLFAGFAHLVVLALLPIYGIRAGFGEGDAVLMLTAFLAGMVVLQLPLGWLSDRVDRSVLLVWAAALCLAGAVLLPFSLYAGAALWPLLFAWGGIVVGLYTVGLSLIGQRFPAHELASANAAFVLLYEIGSVGGPVTAGLAMDLVGPHGLPMALAVAFALLLVTTVWRLRARS